MRKCKIKNETVKYELYKHFSLQPLHIHNSISPFGGIEGALPPEHFIQLLSFESHIGGLSVRRTVRNCT